MRDTTLCRRRGLVGCTVAIVLVTQGVAATTARSTPVGTASRASPPPVVAPGQSRDASSLLASPRQRATFGPFDAGVLRPVTRQGSPGRARRAHPAVGAAAHVPGDGPAPPPLRQDPHIPEGALDNPNALGGPRMSSNPLWLAALVYQHLLTRLDGPRCQHLPTCSRFAAQAVARHGALGIVIGLDRMIQPTESSALRRLPEVEGWGGLRGFDPVDNYEFWNVAMFTGMPPPVGEVPPEFADPLIDGSAFFPAGASSP